MSKEVTKYQKTVTILIFDVDSFKDINTEYGHAFGDEVLGIIGKCIKDTYEQYGTCYHYGGDEFVVILEKQHDYEKLNNIFVSKLEKVRFEEKRKSGRRIPYVSIGCARFDPKVQEAFEAFEIADKDMYFWKGEGKKKRSNEQ